VRVVSVCVILCNSKKQDNFLFFFGKSLIQSRREVVLRIGSVRFVSNTAQLKPILNQSRSQRHMFERNEPILLHFTI
jgi:hypothetical protein